MNTKYLKAISTVAMGTFGIILCVGCGKDVSTAGSTGGSALRSAISENGSVNRVKLTEKGNAYANGSDKGTKTKTGPVHNPNSGLGPN